MKKYANIVEHSFEHKAEIMESYAKGVKSYPPFDPREKVARLMQGAIDVHSHVGPCFTSVRRSEIDYATSATEAGMGAIVIKGMSGSTARSSAIVQEALNRWAKEQSKKPCKVLGGVTLGYAVGGLNVDAVLNSAQLGGKFVWTPVMDSSHIRKIEGSAAKLGHGIDVLDENDEVVPALKEIFKVISEYDLVLSLSHQSTRERLIMVDCARELGVKRINIVHVFQLLTKLDIEQMKMFIAKGCYLEHLFRGLEPYCWRWDETLAAFKQVGVDRFVLGSDLGNWRVPDPVDMYKITVGLLLELGVSEKDVEKLVRLNAERLIWGEP